MTDTVTINSQTGIGEATLLVAEGSGSLLIQNNGPNTLWIGDTPSIQATDARGIVPVPPGSSVPVDGSADVYGTVAQGLPTTVFLISGGQNFFQPLSSLTIPIGATSGERIVINGATGTITGYKANGNVCFQLTPLAFFMYQ